MPIPSGSASTTRGPTRRSTASTQLPTSSSISTMQLVACSPKHAARVNQPGAAEGYMPVHKPALDPQSVEALPQRLSGTVSLAGVAARGACARGCTGPHAHRHQHGPLLPGKESSMRHWHTHEDEFVYILRGRVVLRTDGGEQGLRAGMCAGFAAGCADGHQLINRSAGRQRTSRSATATRRIRRTTRIRTWTSCGACARAHEDDAPRRHALVMSCLSAPRPSGAAQRTR